MAIICIFSSNAAAQMERLAMGGNGNGNMRGVFPANEKALQRYGDQMDLQSMPFTPQCEIGNCYSCSCTGRSVDRTASSESLCASCVVPI